MDSDATPVDIVRLVGPPYDGLEFTVAKGSAPLFIEFGYLTEARNTGEMIANKRVPNERRCRYVLDDDFSNEYHDGDSEVFVLRADPWPYNESA